MFCLNHESRASGVAKLSRRMFKFNMTRQRFNVVSNPRCPCRQSPPRKYPDDEMSHSATVPFKCRSFVGLVHPNLYIAAWKTSVHMSFWTQERVAASSVTKHFSASSSPCLNASDPKSSEGQFSEIQVRK